MKRVQVNILLTIGAIVFGIVLTSMTAQGECWGDSQGRWGGVCPTARQKGDQVEVTWRSCSNFDFYQVRWSRPGRGDSQIKINSGGNNGSWALNRINHGVEYTFKVQGCNGGGVFGSSDCSSWSEIHFVTR